MRRRLGYLAGDFTTDGRQTGAERVRFTTSGTLATMYAVMLSRAFSGRTLVIKVGGGWHVAQPWALKGVGFRGGVWYQGVETEGLPMQKEWWQVDELIDGVVTLAADAPGSH